MTKKTEDYGLMVGDTPKSVVHGAPAYLREGVDSGFDPVFDLIQFQDKFKQTYDGPPRDLPVDLQEFRSKFLSEELREYHDAVIEGDRATQLDALIDLVYVAIGTAYLNGFDFREAWRRVHRANMGKEIARVDGDERSHRDVKFDIVKPEGWLPPNHDDLVS